MPSFFWDVMQRGFLVTKASGQLIGPSSRAKGPLNVGPIVCTETSVITSQHCLTCQKSEDHI